MVLEAGRMIGVGHTVRQASEWAAAGHNVVECVPMPRVTFRRLPENEDAWEKFVVSVNGVDVIWFDFAMDAHRAARDLRRALRGK